MTKAKTAAEKKAEAEAKAKAKAEVEAKKEAGKKAEAKDEKAEAGETKIKKDNRTKLQKAFVGKKVDNKKIQNAREIVINGRTYVEISLGGEKFLESKKNLESQVD